MLYRDFITFIELHIEELSNNWISEILRNPSTKGYNQVDEKELYLRIHDVYLKLSKYLIETEPLDAETAKHFIRLGEQRARENIKSSEIIYALILARKIMWKYVVEHFSIQSAIELHQALEFNEKINSFFDKAAYFTAIGIENSIRGNIHEEPDQEFISQSIKAITNWLITDKT